MEKVPEMKLLIKAFFGLRASKSRKTRNYSNLLLNLQNLIRQEEK